MSENCPDCQAEIITATNSRTGKAVPLDAAPSQFGNCLIWRADDGVRYTTLTPTIAGLLRKEQVPLRQSHLVTCPDSDYSPRSAA